MTYRYAVDRVDRTDLASGSVLRSAPGFPAFPVRLASEVFQRAAALRGSAGRLTVWDPCCGSGYLLTVLGLLHRDRIGAVLGSDAAEAALPLAGANLGLLLAGGLRARQRELAALADAHGRPSHLAAVAAAGRLADEVEAAGEDPEVVTATADVFRPDRLAEALAGRSPDLVITDVPYGDQTEWSGAPAGVEPLPAMLTSVASVLPADAVLAVACRARRVPLGGLPRIGSLRVGTRAVALLRAGDLRAVDFWLEQRPRP
ncbi:rRNA methyltransferase [Solihabitans fulvus]|uniref:rRNA methyltransferase n=1 Tax=Solihabitans fulvus TaxID=1892852 RepID=A0A5B2XG26_9PSEU|nr:rRNA methyltransferase [Solihabitans fulvus]KAA2262226.1 rRNA methyltransferase [Solihabitans fulvus]